MDWFSMDTDVFRDGKIRELIRDYGSEGWHVFSYVVAETAEKIDIDNENNGFFDSEEPIKDIEWGTRIDEDTVEETLNKMADIDLIDSEEWEKGNVFIPTLLERKQTETYLSRQRAGRKSAKNRNKGNSDASVNGTVDGSVDGTSTQPALDVDVDKEEEGEKIKEVYDFWIEKEAGVKHRSLKDAHKKSIRARLRDGFMVSELKQAIDNLAKARHSDDYYWSHKWTLKEFMSRQEGGKVEQFLEGIEEFKRDDLNGNDKLEQEWEDAD